MCAGSDRTIVVFDQRVPERPLHVLEHQRTKSGTSPHSSATFTRQLFDFLRLSKLNRNWLRLANGRHRDFLYREVQIAMYGYGTCEVATRK